MNDSFHLKFRIWTTSQGQDLLECALLAGFVAVTAAAIVPGLANYISEILGKILSTMPWAVSHGSVK